MMTNGHDIDYCKFSNIKSAPTLYGIIHSNQSDAGHNEPNVEFVASGEYEWLDKNNPHTLTAPYQNDKLKKYTGLPRSLTPMEPYTVDDPTHLFTPTET